MKKKIIRRRRCDDKNLDHWEIHLRDGTVKRDVVWIRDQGLGHFVDLDGKVISFDVIADWGSTH